MILDLVGLSVICCVALYAYLVREKKRIDAIAEDLQGKGEVRPIASESLKDLYDFHPDFRDHL